MKALIIATSGFRVIMFITGLMCSYFGIKHIRKNNDLIGFILLPILSSIDSATYLYYAIIKFNKPAFITFSNYTQIFYLGLELIVITAFFLKINITNKNNFKKLHLYTRHFVIDHYSFGYFKI